MPDFDYVNYESLVKNFVYNTIVSYSYSIKLFVRQFFAVGWSWIFSKILNLCKDLHNFLLVDLFKVLSDGGCELQIK